MAAHFRALFLAIISLSLISSLISSSEAAGISTYWGQHTDEGSLVDACQRGTYDYIMLAFLIDVGGGQTPVLNLAGHCDPSSTCSMLSSEIRICQDLGIQVLLSIGGAPNISSSDDAQEVATYIYNTFLGGESQSRPLGDAVLDGVDFHIQAGNRAYLPDFARALSAYNTAERRVHLSAAPQCFYPDYYLDGAISTGLFDYVWVQFYNNPSCQYSQGETFNLLNSWNTQWTSQNGINKLFVGLPAAPEAAPSGGFMLPPVLINDVLPVVRNSPSYGGVMLWNRYFDIQTEYSEAIRPYVNPESDVTSKIKSPRKTMKKSYVKSMIKSYVLH